MIANNPSLIYRLASAILDFYKEVVVPAWHCKNKVLAPVNVERAEKVHETVHT